MLVGKNTLHHKDVIFAIVSCKPHAALMKIPQGHLRTQQPDSEVYMEQKALAQN